MAGRWHLVSKRDSWETTACGLPSYRRSRTGNPKQVTCDACLLAIAKAERPVTP